MTVSETDTDADREMSRTREEAGRQKAQEGKEDPAGEGKEETFDESRMEGDDEVGRMFLLSDKVYFREYLQEGRQRGIVC